MFFPFPVSGLIFSWKSWKRNRKWSVLLLLSAPFLLYLVGWCFGLTCRLQGSSRKKKCAWLIRTGIRCWKLWAWCTAISHLVMGVLSLPFASFALSSSWFPEVSFYFRGILIPRCYSMKRPSEETSLRCDGHICLPEARAVFRILAPFSTQALLSAVSNWVL